MNQQQRAGCLGLAGFVVVVVAQPVQADTVKVSALEINPTRQGIEIVLKTRDSKPLQVFTSSYRNTFVANVLNSQLQLPSGNRFRQEKPMEGIAYITVTSLNANSIRIVVIGETGLPKGIVTQSDRGLVMSLTAPAQTTAQKPTATPATPDSEPAQPASPDTQPTETPIEATAPTTEEPQPEAGEDEEIEIVVTGEQELGYSVPNASTATRTDTPLRDIPQSIQVVPQQVIRDQQVTRLEEALRNVSGVIFRGDVQGRGEEFTIRGFDNVPILRDGFRRYGSFENFPEVANLDRIEVLKGPASILYGEIQPGGLINLVSKKPLAEPFYEAELQVGNWGFVRPRIDISKLLTDDGRLRYRLNALYRRGDSFRGFDQEDKRFFIAPVVSWKISPSTDLTVSLEYTDDKRPVDLGLPVVGDRVVDVPRDRIVNEPDDKIESQYLQVGYDLEHRFNDNWKLRNAFRYSSYEYDYNVLAYDLGDYDEENGILNRFFASQDGQDKNYALQTNLIGEFTTGAIAHTLLFGVDLSRNDERTVFCCW